ncbi:MAG: metal-sensitive transcriptional regulator [Candidatus Obscuribacterales bacterium]
MAITDDNKDRLKLRLSKAIGHLNHVHKMVDEKRYCIDVLHQLKAVQSALDRTAELMLKQHLNTCVVEAVQNNDSDRVMEELWQLLRNTNSATAEDEEELATSATSKSKCCG